MNSLIGQLEIYLTYHTNILIVSFSNIITKELRIAIVVSYFDTIAKCQSSWESI